MAIYKFNPDKEKAMDNDAELAPGLADFKIIGIYDKDTKGKPITGKNNTPAFSISMRVTDQFHASKIMYEKITIDKGFIVRQILAAMGFEQLYNADEFDNEILIQGSGQCRLAFKPHYQTGEQEIHIDKYLRNPKQMEFKRDVTDKNAAEKDIDDGWD